MRIGFDISQTGTSKAGCGYFADGLIRHLEAADTENEYILYPAVGDLYWDPEYSRKTFQPGRRNFRRLLTPRTFEESQAFWRNPDHDLEAKLGNPDILHLNNFFCPSTLRKTRLVYTLYDLSYLQHPEWTTEANRVGCFDGVFKCSLHADIIIAISEHTRRHFLQTYPHYPAERIRVVYPGSRFTRGTQVSRPEQMRQLEPGKFWLNVATLEPRKNHMRLAQAYAKLKSHSGTFPLVLAGGRGWLMEDFERTIDKLDLSHNVVLAGYLSDRELQWLYENCFAFVFPSLFEGFGLPVLEAMSVGASVICSDTSSMPEIVGSAGILVNPYEADGIFEAMLRLQTGSGADRGALRARAYERSKAFSWETAAKQVLEIYKEVFSG